jgi:GGDEF domain-containing protein
VGIAIYPDHGLTSNDLISHADIAMYSAKRKGRNCYAIYQPD